jgi:hypothetical protein
LIQSAAAKRFQMIKNEVMRPLRRAGLDEIDLNQQFFNRPMQIPIMGMRGQTDFLNVTPDRLGGTDDFDFDIEDASESLNQQQRRSRRICGWGRRSRWRRSRRRSGCRCGPTSSTNTSTISRRLVRRILSRT